MKRILLILMVFEIFAASCKKNSGAGGSTITLRQYFSGAPQYTLFNKALQRTSVDTLLGGAIPYTVFAVGDSDMIKSGYTSGGIDTADVQQLRRTLLYQIVQGSISKANLQLYQEIPLVTADSNIQAYLEANIFGLFYNGIPVVGVDSGLSNGIIQRMQTMATPPVGDLITTVASIPSLSDFNFVIHRNIVGDYLRSATTASPITAYLPNNAAYAALGLDNLIVLQSTNGGNNHFWSYGALFTNDFFGSSKMAAFFAGTLPIYIWFAKDGYSFYPSDYTYFVIDPGNQYQLVQKNIVATNGVIHIIQPYSY